MPILALGVSYRRAPVELLERLAFPPEEDPKTYRRLLDLPAVSEGLVLSTCNRIEVYASVASYHAGFQELQRFLSEARDVPPEDFAEPLYAHYETHAAEHLFTVACGADSVVVGEAQILTQVRQAYRRAEAEGAVGPTLGALGRAAIRAGKRARSETAIGAAPRGFVEAGADLADRALGGLSGRAAAVVGAGSMASLAAAHLRERGVGRLRVVNRSPERARRLADRAGAEAVPFERLAAAVAASDLVVSSTNAPGAVIGPEVIREAERLGPRAGRPRFLLDLALPRDVDPAVRGMPGTVVADLDDLLAELRGAGDGAPFDLGRVRTIVGEEVDRFESWRRAARLAPLIEALRARGDRVAAAELARLGPRLGGLSPKEREAVEMLAQGIVAKLLHEPIVRLRRRSGPGHGDAAAAVLAELFGLPGPPGDPEA